MGKSAEPLYTAKMQHSAATIEKLVVMQYNTFQIVNKLVRYGIGAAMIAYGLITYERGMFTTYLCLLLGGFMFASVNLRPKHNARLIIQQMGNKFPSSDYTFTANGFKDGEKSKEIPYKELIKVIHDRKYLYLYISKQSAYMLNGDTVNGESGLSGLKALITEKTGLKWSSPANFWNFSIRNMRDMMPEKEESYAGDRLSDRKRRFFR